MIPPLLFHLLAQKQALRMEILGMKNSRGSVYAFIKREYNLRGNRQRVLDQFSSLIKEWETTDMETLPRGTD